MIKSITQATRVQQNRGNRLKRGYAKAVRRYLKRSHSQNYKRARRSLPVFWFDEEAVA